MISKVYSVAGRRVVHYDLYRIASKAEVSRDILEDIDQGSTVFVEWPDGLPLCPKELTIIIKRVKNHEFAREVVISSSSNELLLD